MVCHQGAPSYQKLTGYAESCLNTNKIVLKSGESPKVLPALRGRGTPPTKMVLRGSRGCEPSITKSLSLRFHGRIWTWKTPDYINKTNKQTKKKKQNYAKFSILNENWFLETGNKFDSEQILCVLFFGTFPKMAANLLPLDMWQTHYRPLLCRKEYYIGNIMQEGILQVRTVPVMGSGPWRCRSIQIIQLFRGNSGNMTPVMISERGYGLECVLISYKYYWSAII